MRRLEMILSRLVWFVPTMAGLVIIVFLISNVIPTDPVEVLLGENADARADRGDARQARLRPAALGPARAALPATSCRAISASASTASARYRRTCAQRLPATLELTLTAITLSVALGIPLGVISALKRNSLLDHILRVVSVSGLAIAAFWLALLLQFFFAMKLGVAPLNSRIDGIWPYAR